MIFLSEQHFSTDITTLTSTCAGSDKLLIIQDLDGVCMGLVRDPLTRHIDPAYLRAARQFNGDFYVLTNGEHVGRRGVNGLVDRALADHSAGRAKRYYLPGLAAGGVQFQDARGVVTHPGVTAGELEFLSQLPELMSKELSIILEELKDRFANTNIREMLNACILDNLASPTLNINHLHSHLRHDPEIWSAVQKRLADFMNHQLDRAARKGLGESFFIHYAPNLGRDSSGKERLMPPADGVAGTHDFQFMISGAVKEAGVLVLLNHYYFSQTGTWPLGQGFNARCAPPSLPEMKQLALRTFDRALMPRIVGVGDTVTSAEPPAGQDARQRGGSDRAFLTLIQDLGTVFDTDNAVVLVDSSQGELDRPGIRLPSPETAAAGAPDIAAIAQGISDPQDPLKINFVFPRGHQDYVSWFIDLARRRHPDRAEP